MNNDIKNKIIRETQLGYNGFFKLKRHTIQYDNFDGSKSRLHQREVLVREPTVAALMYDPVKNAILLTEQFRVGPLENNCTPWIFELPAGIVEAGENLQVAIEREVFEETGYDCKVDQLIGEFYLSPGGTNEVTSLFYTEVDLRRSGLHGAMGENEDILTHIVAIGKALELMQQGKLSAVTALGLMWLKANNKEERINVN